MLHDPEVDNDLAGTLLAQTPVGISRGNGNTENTIIAVLRHGRFPAMRENAGYY